MYSERHPLSFPQQAIFLDSLLHGPTTKFTMGAGIVVRGALNETLFRQAIEFASRQHDVLRMRLRVNGDEVWQEFIENVECRVEVMDFSGNSTPFQSAVDWMFTDYSRPIRDEEFPLSAEVLFRLGDDLHLWYSKFHHVSNDGYGHALMTGTVAAAYNSLLARGRLPEMERRSYIDFIREDREYAASARFRQDEEFWQHKFPSMPEPLPFTARKGGLTGDVLRTQRYALSLHRLVYNAILRLCDETGVTTSQFLQAVLLAYLNRITGRDDIVVGTPILNRSNHAFRSTVGMFMNMMPLRIKLTREETVLGLARQIAAETKSFYRHQRFPFGEILRHCRTRDGFCHTVYDVTFVYRKSNYDLKFGESLIRPVSLDSQARDETLSVEVDEYNADEDVNIFFNYNPQLISAEEASQMAKAFQALLIDLAIAGDRPIGQLPLLTETATPAGARKLKPVEKTVLDLFAERAAERPGHVAVVDGATRLTYSELAEASSRVAAFLIHEGGIEREQPVAVLCDRSVPWLIAKLGVMKSGGAYLPLDPDSPRDRIEFILRDSGCQLLLAGEPYSTQEFPGVRSVRIQDAVQCTALDSGPRVGVQSLAYIIYTSGTTGQPKGVMVEHAGVANAIGETVRQWGLKPADNVLQFASAVFDASMLDVFTALTAGSRLVIAPKDVVLDPPRFLDLLSREQVSIAALSPAYLSALGRPPLPTLRVLCTAGEAANPADVAHYSRFLVFSNGYGPTETSIIVTLLTLEAGAGFTGERVPLGKPLARTEIYILDDDLRLMPVGAAGEIYIGGVNVSRGYLNRPELNSQRFIPNPFQSGERLFRSGDIGRQLPDGSIEYLGRRDTQVKVRGYRVELGEIETILKTHPAVESTAVAASDGDLVAYVVPRGDFHPGDLRRFLALKLPAYMIPARWVRMAAFPLNFSGKIDRGALPAPPPPVSEAEDAEAALTPLEKTLAGIWEEVLGTGPISRMADFFELGGHSLKAAAILSRIQQNLGVRVPMKDFFAGATIAQLATVLEKAQDAPVSPDEISVRDGALSSLQERIWLVSQLDPAGTAYVMPCHLRVRGKLDTGRLEESIRYLWRRYDTLRSIFPSRNGRPVRTVLPGDALTVYSYDLSDWKAHYLAHHAEPFNLEEGPLLRACIYRIAPDEHVVLIDIHHINGDGHSLEVLRSKLFEVYQALVDDRRPALPSPGAGYDKFIEDEIAQRQSAAFRAALEERVKELAGAPTRIDFQFDKPLPERFAHEGGSLLWRYDDLTQLRRSFELGRGEGLSPFMVMLAAYGTMLHLHTGQEDLLIGIPTSLRGSEQFEHTVGFFVNTCVARLDFSGSPTLREIMRRTSRAVRDMLRCPEAPFDHLVRTLRGDRTPNRPPLVQAALSFLMDEVPFQPAARDLTVEPAYVARDSAMFELSLDIILRGNQGICNLEYSTGGWEETSAKRMLDHFHAILAAITDQPDLPLREIDLAAPGALLGEPLEDAVRTVPDWVAEHARNKPDSTALISGGTLTTYAQLGSLVAVRRGQLSALGLKAGAVLALDCDPGLEWTATALAAMAEGIVVLPLDANAPEARRQYVLDNAGAALLWQENTSREAPPSTPRPGGSKANPKSTAYLIYTSGTTGQPKGVRVSHGAFETHCRSAIAAYGLRADDRALVFASLHFDAAWEQLFAPLVVGASVLIRDAELWAPEECCRQITQQRITCADLPPQYLRELLFFLKKAPGSTPQTLRLVISGGEAISSSLAEEWVQGPLRHVPLINAYGPTEAVVTSTYHRIGSGTRIAPANAIVPIGGPMPGRVLYILNENGMEVGAGIAGELCIGGPCLAEGYQGDDAHTAEVFRYWRGGRWTDADTPGCVRLYRSGDRVRLGPDNRIEFLGRIDKQIKIRGFRIEPAEVEARLTRHLAIAQALVVSVGQDLVAYCIPTGTEAPSRGELNEWLSQWLPDYMLPAAIVFLPAFPTGASGKIDISALPPPEARRETQPAPVSSADEMETRVAAIWADVLGRTRVGLNDNFFDLGGHSLLLVRVHTRLVDELGAKLRLVDLFANPTVARMAKLLRGEDSRKAARGRSVRRGDIAVIGMSGRFPGAANVDELWANLAAGKESIRFFTDDELATEGVPPALRSRPDYVPAHGYLEGSKLFDAAFFGYTPREAEMIDPQQRLFLEEAWHALENAGYDPSRHVGDVGVFGGVGMDLYLLDNLSPRMMRQDRGAEAYSIGLTNDKDFITTRVSYKLDLRGPSVNVNTACSTSLVAIHMAAESLLRGECDLALAGGVTLHVPPVAGYVYQPGGIASPDGHCRAFADDATGTVGGSGAAVVVLKPLEQALADGDTIHAVIKGSAINNDGADKVGFTAPSVNRQRDVIRAALDSAGVSAASIGYVEAHGTGTPMGDPIEIEALQAAFAPDNPELQSCLIGSVKSNIGHLDTAAGVTGFIKAVLALENNQIPPTLHCQRPASQIGFERTPFRVAQQLTPWPGDGPRRAGVSSFGMGGTNAHVVLEEAPAVDRIHVQRPEVWCIPISARSVKSVLASAANLARHIEEHPDVDPADFWFTLSEGRRRWAARAVVLAASPAEAVAALRAVSAADVVPSGSGNPCAADFAGRREFEGALAFAKAWLTGEQSEASKLLPAGPQRRIPLPGYAFDHERYWVERIQPETDSAAKLPVSEWFYFPDWERVPGRRDEFTWDSPVTVVHNGSTAEASWMDSLRAAGIRFTAHLAGQKFEDSAALAHCWHIGAMGLAPGGPGDYARHLDALLSDIRALAAARNGQPTQLLLIAPQSNPDSAYLNAVCAVIPHEYSAIAAKVLYADAVSSKVLRAAALPGNDHSLAVWGDKLLRRTFRKLPAGDPERGASRLRQNGVYLITGGIGGIGLALADHLAHTLKARLVLVSRSEPDTAQRQAIQAMEAAGAEVRTAALDVADSAALRALVDDVCTRWDRIDGVIHAAGVPGGSLVARTRLDEIERVLRAKVNGTEALAAALEGREPSFVILCSSLTATLGGPGQTTYAAANVWMDAFAEVQSIRKPGVWTSVQWDTWAEAGMAAHIGSVPRTLLKEWQMTPASYWPWGEHRIAGTPTLPGTAYLELFAQALGATPVEFGPVVLFEPMVPQGEDPVQMQVDREGDDLVFRSSAGTEHARAHHRGVPAAPTLEPLAAIQARCTTALDPAREDEAEGIVIESGPRWAIKGTYWKGQDEALGSLELPARFATDLAEHPLHPALLDVAISFYITWVEGGTGLLPWRYERIRVFAPLTASVVSHLRLRSRSERSLVLDADLRDTSGRLLMQVEGYTLLQTGAAHSRRENQAALKNPFAMTRKEGVEAFLRVLDTAEPVVSISTVEWKHAAKVAPVAGAVPDVEQPSDNRQPRPEIATPFREAGTDAEKLMARVWAEVLGYDRIGIDDDLFDLGADSLTALQASTRLNELTGHELPMDRFFDDATVANLAKDLTPEPVAAAKWEEGEL